MSKTILIADDDSMIMQIFSLGLEQADADVRVHSATTGNSAIDAIERVKPDVLVLDIRMPQGDGFTVLDYLKKQKSTMPVVILTNYRNDEYITKCKTYGVKEYLVKHEMKIDRIVERVSACFA
jgi:two-component system response regulator YesN